MMLCVLHLMCPQTYNCQCASLTSIAMAGTCSTIASRQGNRAWALVSPVLHMLQERALNRMEFPQVEQQQSRGNCA